ncbi:MAG: hypothetical protein ABGZ23_21965 [Fuerstiella sp.]|nr:DUF983 domain-containing protein [Fuerstiella sp.]
MSDDSNDIPYDIGDLTLPQAIVRGVTLRCPACARGKLFRGLIQMNKRCSDCEFSFERDPGYFLGSTYINYGFTAATTTVSYVVLHFGLGYTNGQLLPGLATFCLIFPLVFFRFARSLWLSLDCYIDRVGASEAMSGTRQAESSNLNSTDRR